MKVQIILKKNKTKTKTKNQDPETLITLYKLSFTEKLKIFKTQ